VRARAAAAVVLAMAALPAPAADFGTLLTTPQERERLDRLRRGEPQTAAGAAGRGGPGHVTGFVKRSDGRGTLWIDGVPTEVNSARALPLLEPGAVHANGGSGDDRLRIERRSPR
jgi:hypothetical protein